MTPWHVVSLLLCVLALLYAALELFTDLLEEPPCP